MMFSASFVQSFKATQCKPHWWVRQIWSFAWVHSHNLILDSGVWEDSFIKLPLCSWQLQQLKVLHHSSRTAVFYLSPQVYFSLHYKTLKYFPACFWRLQAWLLLNSIFVYTTEPFLNTPCICLLKLWPEQDPDQKGLDFLLYLWPSFRYFRF